jgi:hypothetical protein
MVSQAEKLDVLKIKIAAVKGKIKKKKDLCCLLNGLRRCFW